MATILYLDLFSGAAGDMLLGALVDLGLPLEVLRAELGKMDLSGYELEAERQVRRGISGTRLHVRDLARAHPARHLPDIRRLLEGSRLSPKVRDRSLAVFERLARAEARVHHVSVDEVHFHEIGAVDTLVDVVGFVLGLESLSVERVYASPVPLGSGFVQTEHGLLPVPAPATAALLAEVSAPVRPHPAPTEILTPTAAALLAELATFGQPPMRVRAVGYGFGEKEFPWPNAVRAWLGDSEEALAQETVCLLECNLDDATGEVLGYVMERLFAAGALDVWFTPIQMKKHRPGVMLSALARPEGADTLAALILRETPTLGVRRRQTERVIAERREESVETEWGTVRVKEKWLDGQKVAVSPEYEDCARIARERGVPLSDVYAAVLRVLR
ncbi:MAG: nickel pincer cofactor biosynthesis protein LarC [Anaerolineae bacterium]|nr:nickel pincer cofactor biosynthesis protein LarC [Anaerolineae bacterium]MDW8068238.1 nickel pincer cofactor biosynthesis protein LarC [Anaerolineae bacterium]